MIRVRASKVQKLLVSAVFNTYHYLNDFPKLQKWQKISQLHKKIGRHSMAVLCTKWLICQSQWTDFSWIAFNKKRICSAVQVRTAIQQKETVAGIIQKRKLQPYEHIYKAPDKGADDHHNIQHLYQPAIWYCRFGLVVTHWSWSTMLLYVGPG